jgi:alpha-D-xyloside xylohydrolase
VLIVVCASVADASPVALDRDGSTVVLEAYAPNIILVAVSLNKDGAPAALGYGFVATPAADGWTHQQSEKGDVYRSSRLIVTVGVNRPGKPMATEVDIAKVFIGSTPPANISIQTPEGKTLLQMTGWSMSVPNPKDSDAGVLNDKRPDLAR